MCPRGSACSSGGSLITGRRGGGVGSGICVAGAPVDAEVSNGAFNFSP